MNNKTIKFLISVLTIMTVFFMKIDTVKADKTWKEVEEHCDYISPMSFISNDKKASIVYLNLKKTSNYIKNAGTYELSSFCLRRHKGDIYYLTAVVNKYGTDSNGSKITRYFMGFTGVRTLNPISSDKHFIKLRWDPDLYFYDFNEVSKGEYQDYIKNKQNKNMPNDPKYLYHIINVDVFDDGDHYMFSPNFIDTFKGDIYFIKADSSLAEKYPNEQWSLFDDMCATANEEGNISCDDAKAGLETVLDTGDYDNRAFTKAYYDATKDKWKSYMSTTNSKAPQQKTGIFSYWFDYIGRYAYEENNSATFKLYWNYICDNNAYTVTEEQCNAVNDFLDDKDKYKKSSTNKNTLGTDPCMAKYAPQCVKDSNLAEFKDKYNATACAAQKKESGYTTCSSCIKNCDSQIKTTESGSKSGCYKTCIGDDGYEKYLELMADYDEQMKNAAVDGMNKLLVLYNLKTANAPTLNLSFSGNYVVDCDDFKVLKTIYDIFTLMAPVLVILFGSIDYTKAVIASDEEKRRKAQKKFVPRIIAAVLLILIPVIVRLILSFAGLSDSALSCIVN